MEKPTCMVCLDVLVSEFCLCNTCNNGLCKECCMKHVEKNGVKRGKIVVAQCPMCRSDNHFAIQTGPQSVEVCWGDILCTKIENSPTFFAFHGVEKLFPMPRPNHVYRELGIGYIPIDDKPVKNDWTHLCELCGGKDRAAFPYRLQSTEHDLDDASNVTTKYACPECVDPSSVRFTRSSDALANFLEKRDAKHFVFGPYNLDEHVREFRRLVIEKCWGSKDKARALKAIFDNRRGCVPISIFETTLDLLTVCYTNGEYHLAKALSKACQSLLVNFTSEKMTRMIHKCLYPSKSAYSLALTIYYARRGVFSNMKVNDYNEAYVGLGKFLNNPTVPDSFLKQRSPNAASVIDTEIDRAKRDLEMAQDNYDRLCKKRAI